MGPKGLEPLTFRASGGCSSQLSYNPGKMYSTMIWEERQQVFADIT